LTNACARAFLISFQVHAFRAQAAKVSQAVLAGGGVEYRPQISRLNPKGAPMSEPNQSGLSDNAAGGLAYITIIPAIIFLIVEPFNKNSFVRFHSWQCIFLAIAWFAADIVLMILGRLPFIGLINLILWPLVGLGFFILWIVCLINAFNGKRFKVPVIGDFAEKQANS
jgi:uncharacterized membrane protein